MTDFQANRDKLWFKDLGGGKYALLVSTASEEDVALMKYRSVTRNTTQDLVSDFAIFADTTPGDVTITLPLASTTPNDGYVREFYIHNSGGGNKAIVQLSGSDEFPNGIDHIGLPKANQTVHIGVIPSGWSYISAVDVVLQARRSATWDASNFASAAAIPFDVTDIEDCEEVLAHDTAVNPTRITAGANGRYRIAGWLGINSTGGFTWTMTGYLRKNGTTTVDGSTVYTGNYGNEDQGVSFGPLYLDLVDGDYIEWVIDHTNLTGRLENATLVAKITL